MKTIILKEYCKAVAYLLATVLLLVLVLSCGARHKETTAKEESVKTEIQDNSATTTTEQDNSVIDSSTKVNAVAKTIKKQTSIKPLDPSKPSSAITPDGKKYELNNAEVNITETNEDAVTKTENKTTTNATALATTATQKAIKANQEANKKEAALQVNRDAVSVFSFWWLWLILFVLFFWFFRNPIIYFFTKKTIV